MRNINNTNYEGECDLFSFLGSSLNENIYKRTTNNKKHSKDLSIKDLKTATKDKLYGECDERLKNFIDCLTELKITANDNIAFKSNIYENILKARNNKYVSVVGLKEHMVVYLASGKSCHASQVFSKQGGKGTRPVLEIILKNSESVCKFKAPENITLFFSFDNIQTLLKSHRIGGPNQKEILVIVVCSILCYLPEGHKRISEIQ